MRRGVGRARRGPVEGGATVDSVDGAEEVGAVTRGAGVVT